MFVTSETPDSRHSRAPDGGAASDAGAASNGGAIDADRVVVREVTEADAQILADHLQRCFGRWPPYELDCSVADHVAWKMTANAKSAAEQIIATLVDDDQFVVAFTIRIRRPGWIQGERHGVIDVGDQSVHPDWRQIHINQKRREFRVQQGQDDYDVQMQWLPHHPATRKSGLQQATIGNRVLVLFRPGSLRSLLRVPLRSAGWRHAVGVLIEATRRRLSRRGDRVSGSGRRAPRFAGRVEALERFDDRTDAVWEAAKQEFDFSIERTQDYLNWRYADPRAGRFTIRAALEGDELLGYAVLKPHSDPGGIVDLLVRPGRLDALDALIADAVALIDSSGRRDINVWLPGTHPYAATLRDRGFLDSGRDPSFRYDAGVMAEEELAFLTEPSARVHVMQGDSDFT
jgi:hypothetical protein